MAKLTSRTNTIIVAGVLTLVTSSQGIFTTASKVDGHYQYNFGTIVFLAELVGHRCRPPFAAPIASL